MSELKIFHYHFQTGGVTTVVRQAVEALRRHLPAIRSIQLIAARIPDEFYRQTEGFDVEHVVFPQIGYSSAAWGRERVREEAEALAAELLRRFGSAHPIWWIHNYHLGKNVVFTQALLHIIRGHSVPRIILQIHDFPESGRFANLRLLKECLSLDPYPCHPRVRYAVLNERDRTILVGAGLPEKSVFLLENPVFAAPVRPTERPVRTVLQQRFGSAFPRFDADRPLLLYPVRTIRRKNAMEAMLLTQLLGIHLQGDVNLLLTLPGVSQAEGPYSDRVEGLFREGLCPGLFGIGARLGELSLHHLAEASDMIVSTSVQEGFGYLFINSLLWSVPLCARELSTMVGLKSLFHGYPAHFYSGLSVPAFDRRQRTRAYRRKIAALADLIGAQHRASLLAEIEAMQRREWLDFSFLSVSAQESLLRRIASGDRDLAGQCGALNADLLQAMGSLLTAPSPPASRRDSAIRWRFGARAYAAGFRRILESFDGADTACNTGLEPGCIGEAVLASFLHLDQLRLLYDDRPDALAAPGRSEIQ